METIRGIVTKFLAKDEKSFVLVKYEDPETGELKVTKMNARLGSIEEGDAFLAEGTWKDGFYRGQPERTFQATTARPAYPRSLEGIRLFLDLSFPRKTTGLDHRVLHALTTKYQKKTIEELFSNPELLVAASTDPEKYRDAIHEIVAAKGAGLQARELLTSASIEEKTITKFLSRHKASAYETLMEDPWTILELPEVTLEDADRLAAKVGLSTSDERRIAAVVWSCIRAAEQNDGSSMINLTSAIPEISLKSNLPSEVIRAAINKKVAERDRSKYCVFQISDSEDWFAQSTVAHQHELTIAHALCSFVQRRGGNDPERVAAVADEVLADTLLDDVQKEAVIMAATHQISVITGGPGTGKSTILKSVTRVLEKLGGTEVIMVAAPTGKAAQRAEETAGRNATTIQMLLGMHKDERTGQNTFRVNRDNPLPENCLVIVDEISMADNELFAALLAAMPASGRLVLLGDPNQLPSVGVGRVLSDLLEMNIDGKNLIPVTKLRNVYRQDKDSKIVKDSESMLKGEVPILTPDFRGGTTFHECPSHEITNRILKMFQSTLRDAGVNIVKDVAVISPQGPNPGGTWELNEALAKELNPSRTPLPGVDFHPMDRRKDRMPLPQMGDRVMLTENDHSAGVMNGDVGFVTGYREHPDNPGRYLIEVEFDNGKTVEVPSWSVPDNLLLSYAITCHKSQGSQFPIVVLPFSDKHMNMADRTLVFTAWTRAKKFVIGVGSKEVFANFVCTDKSLNRFTILRALTETLAQNQGLRPLGNKAENLVPRRYPRSAKVEQSVSANSPQPLSARPNPSQTTSSGGGPATRRRIAPEPAPQSRASSGPAVRRRAAPANIPDAPTTTGPALRRRTSAAPAAGTPPEQPKPQAPPSKTAGPAVRRRSLLGAATAEHAKDENENEESFSPPGP
jgi:exodeoxyribonuclease V alpha subunit